MTTNSDMINSQLTPGQMIKAAREDKNLSISDISQKLLLSKNIIIAIEADDYAKIPAQVYAEGYLRAYAQVLDIPLELIIESFRKLKVYSDDEHKEYKKISEKNEKFKLSNLLKVQKIRLMFWSILILVLLGSMIFSVIKFTRKPIASDYAAEDQIVVSDVDGGPSIIIKDGEEGVFVDDSSDPFVEINIPLNLKPPKNHIKRK